MVKRLSHRLLPALVLLAVVWTARTPAAQQAPAQPGSVATFRTEINYVEVSARVMDAQGDFVRNLQKSDFQVLEDKKAQPIASFDLVDVPVERFERPLFAGSPIEPDVATNAHGFEGRIYVLVLDALHTSPMKTPLVRAAARKFVQENLGANDLAGVAVIGVATAAAQDLTANRRLLIAAIDKFVGQKPESTAIQQVQSNNTQVVGGVDDVGGDIAEPDEKERLSNARRTFTVLTRLSEWMSGVRGRRKAIVYLSEGLDYDVAATYNNLDRSPNSSKANLSAMALDEMSDVIAAATRNNVTIYGVDPRGLANLGGDSIEIAMLADHAPVNTSLSSTNPSDPSVQANSTSFRPDYGLFSLQDELRVAQDSLRTLSEETGGFAAVNSNDFTTAFKRIVDDNSSYYLLGYYSTNDKRDGKFRAIDIRINGRPRLVVRARKGYVAPRGKSTTVAAPVTTESGPLSGQLAELISSPVPVASGLTFSATAATFDASPSKNLVLVTLEADGRDLTLKPEAGRYVGKIDTLIVAFDRDGKVQASKRSAVDLGLKPDSYQRLTQQNGRFRFVSQLELAPGTYRLEVAVVDADTKKAGSLYSDLEVPDFSKAPVAMSNLLISSATTSFWPTAADKGLTVTMPLPPTTVRDFAAGDALAWFARVYDNQKTTHMVDITTTIRANDGRSVFENHQEHSSQEIQSARGGFDYAVRFPLKELAPGLYVLNVEPPPRGGPPPL